jgi:hypothetical protein
VRLSGPFNDDSQFREARFLAGDVLSELVVPVIARDELLGMLCFQSKTAGRFSAEDEDLVNVVSRQIGLQMALLRLEAVEVVGVVSMPPPQTAVVVKHYAADDSVFVDDAYVIKGVAGRLLWRLLQAYVEGHRTEFSNREFRLDPSLHLPGYKDNLETRLISLRTRLQERCSFLMIATTGRGKFSLSVGRELFLQEADSSSS